MANLYSESAEDTQMQKDRPTSKLGRLALAILVFISVPASVFLRVAEDQPKSKVPVLMDKAEHFIKDSRLGRALHKYKHRHDKIDMRVRNLTFTEAFEEQKRTLGEENIVDFQYLNPETQITETMRMPAQLAGLITDLKNNNYPIHLSANEKLRAMAFSKRPFIIKTPTGFIELNRQNIGAFLDYYMWEKLTQNPFAANAPLFTLEINSPEQAPNYISRFKLEPYISKSHGSRHNQAGGNWEDRTGAASSFGSEVRKK